MKFSSSLESLALITAAFSTTASHALAVPEPTEAPSATAKACTTGTPVFTSGFNIDYAWVEPTVVLEGGYQPDPSWSSEHLVGTQTFGVPMPIESGFAYAQFKCQYSCNSRESGSFFVKYAGPGNQIGSYCSCFDDLLTPDIFVAGNQTVVGAWNAICPA
ncbi:hypothetical protein UCREL1_5909 [Eutypa lata UCREL1]|uniref:Uncharacterized protein n=1 Tax=Eutypa lata (strain UCR-EL1) TaxID=1287681 RepID=M7SL65_EUTLA|nr:hypothetical protein UCREL1_5909 [Eutypa lata UCREL1]